MTDVNTAPRDEVGTARRTARNDADLRYLEEARAALQLMMSISDAVAGRAARHDVRALARDALSLQTVQLEAISACLLAWDRPGTASRRGAAADALPGVHGPELDLDFAARLTAHAHASMAAARAEMMAGVAPGARAIAEDALRAQSRQLATLDVLPRPAFRQP